MSRRKRPEERQRRNTADAGPLAIVPTRSETAPPPVPKIPGGQKLRADVRRWWAGFWDLPVAELADRRADLPGLERLALLYDSRMRAEAAFRKAPMAEGVSGQSVISPFAREVASIDARILQLEDRFGLSPKARLALGAQIGDAAEGLEKLNAAIVRSMADDDDDQDDGLDPRLRIIEADEA